MQRLLVLFMLVVHIGYLVLIFELVKKLLNEGYIFAADTCYQILIPFEFNVPPVLPRALV